MYCAKCGAFLADDARVCSSCGKPVRIRPAAGRPAGDNTDRADRQLQGAEDRQTDVSRQIMDDEKIMDPAYFEDAAGNPDVESIIRLARGETVLAHEDRTPDEDRTAPITGEDTGRRSSNKTAARSSDHAGTGRKTAADSRSRTTPSSLTAEEKKEAEAARRRQEAAMKRRQASAAKQRKAASKRRRAVAANQERPVYSDRNTRSAVRRNPQKSSMFDGIRRSMAEYTHAMEEAADERQMKKHMASAAKYYASLEMDDDWNDDPFRPYDETAEETAAAEFEPETERTVQKTAPVRPQTAERAVKAEETEKKVFPVSPVKEEDSEFSAKTGETVEKAAPVSPVIAESAVSAAKAGETAEKAAPVSPVKSESAVSAAKSEETAGKASPAKAESPERAGTLEETGKKASPVKANSPEQTADIEEAVKRAVPAETQAAEYGMKEDAAADTAAAGKMFVSAAAVEEIRARLTEEIRPGLEEEIRPGLEKEIRAGLEEEIRTRMETELRASLEKEYAARAGSGRTPGSDSLSEEFGQYAGLFSEEELRIESARRLRKYYDAEQEEIDAAFGLFGLNRAMTVRLATFFLIVVLSVIYVAGRGNKPAAVESGSSGNVSEDAAFQDKDTGSKEEESMEDSVPTGGGEFGGGESSEDE